MNIRVTAFAVSLILGTGSVLFAEPNIKDSWHQWRGPNNNGVAESDAPLNFSPTENVKWKIAIPGKGNSTPIIWGDTIYLTTAVPTEPIPEPQARGGGGGQGGPGRGGQGPGGRGGFDPARMIERLPEEQRKQAEELLNGRSPRDLSDEERQKFREIMRSAFGGRGGPGVPVQPERESERSALV